MWKLPKCGVFNSFVKIVSHPLVILFSFLLLIIEGEQISGFFFQFLLTGNVWIKNFSIVGIIGLSVLFSSVLLRSNKFNTIRSYLSIIGVIMMILSLILFFAGDKTRYYFKTFHLTLPVLLLVFFVIISLVSIIRNFYGPR